MFNFKTQCLRERKERTMKKPIIGIVGREDLSEFDNKSIMRVGDKYRQAVLKSRRYSVFNITNTRL